MPGNGGVYIYSHLVTHISATGRKPAREEEGQRLEEQAR